MNKLVLSALAASVAIGTTNASEGDWAGLDAELNTLTSSLDHHEGGPNLSGYIEAGYDTGGDYDGNAGTPDDDSSWDTGRMGLSVSGSVGGFGYHMDIDGSTGVDLDASTISTSGEPDIVDSDERDAYVTFEKFGIGWTMGQFRAPTTGNHLENEEDMAFATRSALGGFGNRTTGLMASGSMDALGYWIHFGADEAMTARVSYDVMSGDGLNLSLAYSMDDSDLTTGADAHEWMEANVSMSGFSLAYTMGASDFMAAGVDTLDETDSATCLVLSYMVNADWSISIRETDQDVDNTDLDESMDWAINYNDDGARWTIQSLEGYNQNDDAVGFGVIVGF